MAADCTGARQFLAGCSILHIKLRNVKTSQINIMNRQCLDRRLDSQKLMAKEVAAWERERNARKARIHWTFTLAAARRKLRKLYPSIED